MEADEHYELHRTSPREDFLQRAIDIVRERGDSYGPPNEHFQRTCDALNALMPDLFAREITAADWAKVMIVDKVSRDAEAAKLDTCIDIAGYAACLAEVRHWEHARDGAPGWVEEIPR
jgi:hypothetical protein